MKISFDYDGTLSDQEHLRKHARYLLSKGHEVFIVTTRRHKTNPTPKENDEVFKMATSLGVSPKNVVFTECEWKYPTLADLGIDLHYDDNIEELNVYENDDEYDGICFVIVD